MVESRSVSKRDDSLCLAVMFFSAFTGDALLELWRCEAAEPLRVYPMLAPPRRKHTGMPYGSGQLGEAVPNITGERVNHRYTHDSSMHARTHVFM